MSLVDAYDDLQKSRQSTEQWAQENAPPMSVAGIRKWKEVRQEINASQQEKEDQFYAKAAQATPEELTAVQMKIQEAHAEMLKSLEQKHDGVMLPPEARMDAELGLSSASLHERILARREEDTNEALAGMKYPTSLRDAVLQKREEQQGQQDERQSHRMQPNWSAYATTNDELQDMKQLEEDQNALTRELGRRPNSAEVEKYQQERLEKAQQSQQEHQRNNQDEEGQGQSA